MCLGYKIQDTTASTLVVVEYLRTCRTFLIDINFTEFSLILVLIFYFKSWCWQYWLSALIFFWQSSRKTYSLVKTLRLSNPQRLVSQQLISIRMLYKKKQ
jgi:hypothetical protein